MPTIVAALWEIELWLFLKGSSDEQNTSMGAGGCLQLSVSRIDLLRPVIIGIQVLAGVLMVVAALKFKR